MDNKYVFISYSTKNQAEAEALKKVLNDEGIATWMAPGNIPAGTRYAEIINRAVKDCTCFVLVLTDESQNSIWVAKETERAVNYRKPIFPVQLTDVILNDEFELYISTDQIVAVKKIDRNTQEIQKLVAGLIVHTGDNGKKSSPSNISAQVTDSYESGSTLHAEPDLFTLAGFKRKPAPTPPSADSFYIDGKYYNLVEVGRGFMGTTYKATCSEDNSVLAVKKYEPLYAFDVPLFSGYNLSWKIETINHKNLCRLFDVQRNSTPLLVMEYIEGNTLSSYISKPVHNLNRSIEIVQQILEGLSCLHQNDIYYGDLSPENVMLDNTGRVVLSDFSQSNFNNSRIDQRTMLLEKYRSPERCSQQIIDYRSDIFEAGMILDTLTVNEITYSDGWDFTKIKGLHAVDSEVPLMLRKVIIWATELEKENRYQSAAEMLNDLKEISECL